MGSGISLSKTQVIQIVKRDLLQEHIKVIKERKTASNAEEIYYNCLADAKFSIINKKLDKFL